MTTNDTRERLLSRLQELSTMIPPPGDIRRLGQGFGSNVYLTDNGLIVREARNEDARKNFEAEFRLLPRLADLLPIHVPRPFYWEEAGPSSPFGFLVYTRLPGRPLKDDGSDASERLAGPIAGFLATLHGLRPEDHFDASLLRRPAGRDSYEQLFSFVHRHIQRFLREGEKTRLERWMNTFLQSLGTPAPREAICHGDLWYGNLLVDEQSPERLRAIIDFENVGLHDPAVDLMAQLHLGRRFFDKVVELYSERGGQLGPAFEHRVERLWQVRPFGGIRSSILLNDEAEMEDAVDKLRRHSGII